MIDQDIYSNLALIPIAIDSYTWYSAEQFYQASRSMIDGISFRSLLAVVDLPDCLGPRIATAGERESALCNLFSFILRTYPCIPPTPVYDLHG